MGADVKDWTVLSMLEWATDYFKTRDIPDPRLSIEWLLAETLQIKRLDLYLNFDRPLSSAELNTLRPLVKRRAVHEPLQYIIGYSDFMNVRILVTPDVLIPRIETEQLTEIILDRHPSESSLSVLDIGTGSGCIPIALKMERPAWEVSAVEVSAEALSVARQNANANTTKIAFIEGDVFNWENWPIDHTVDLIVSNPPYINPGEKDQLSLQVKNFEPARALFYDDIAQMYKKIIECAENFLADNGFLYLEIHEKHSGKISALFSSKKWNSSVLSDYENKPRFVIASKRL